MEIKWNKLVLFVSAALFLRVVISLHSYSGEGKPPMFGDFEAQRHWQEITVNLPIRDWYENSTDNDLNYWGLDYPPLTAYHSLLLGKWAQKVDKRYVELHTSRGIIDDEHKYFMRITVLIADALIYIPAIFMVFYAVTRKVTQKSEILSILLGLLFPGQIIIDNGHFQYNNISLGLAALAVAGILFDKIYIASFLFTLALNYKQMELYHALPFFFYLLHKSFERKESRFKTAILTLTKLGLVVLGTFAVIWSPWLSSLDSTKQVIHRIFPVARGVFEDKVASFWCTVNVFIKIRENFNHDQMVLVCLASTLIAVLPSGLHLLFNGSKRAFLYSLINTSLAFFLFSFHVHEKSILLVTLPVIIAFPLVRFASFWLLQIATFSMVPLLVIDELITPTVGLSVLTLLIVKMYFSINDSVKPKNDSQQNFIDIFNISNLLEKKDKKFNWSQQILIHIYYLSLIAQALLLYGQFYISPPSNLPYLFPMLISAFSCCHFLLFLMYFNYKQFTVEKSNKKIKYN